MRYDYVKMFIFIMSFKNEGDLGEIKRALQGLYGENNCSNLETKVAQVLQKRMRIIFSRVV